MGYKEDQINLQKNMSMLGGAIRDDVVLSDPGGDDSYSYRLLSIVMKNSDILVAGGLNLYINSMSCGTGKTSWASKIAQSYISRTWFVTSGIRVMFVSVPRYFSEKKMSFGEEVQYVKDVELGIKEADIVIWDEVAVKGLTDFESDQLLSFVDKRINDGKCNIYTSNLNLTELEQCVGKRLYSRIINKSSVITFTGVDHRGY